MTWNGRGYGYQADPPARVAELPRFRSIKGAFASVGESCDLTSFRPDIFDQGGTGSCTAHAKVGALLTAAKYQATPLGFTPSPAFLYVMAQCVGRKPDALGRLPPLADDGAQPGWIEQAIAQYGLIPMGPAVEGRNSDCDASTVVREPDLDTIVAAAHELAVGDYLIEPPFDAGCAGALSLGRVPTIGFWADSVFDGWEVADAPIPPPDRADPEGGWHQAYLTGFEKSQSRFRLVNSWGEDYGAGGECWVSAEFVRAAVGCYATFVRLVRR